jgi:hypothetical protein
VQIRKVIQKRIRHAAGGVSVVGDVNAAIAANVNEAAAESAAAATDDSARTNDKEERNG